MGGVSSLPDDSRVNEIKVVNIIQAARLGPQPTRRLHAELARHKGEDGCVPAALVKTAAIDALHEECAHLREELASAKGVDEKDLGTKAPLDSNENGWWEIHPNSKWYKNWWAASAALAMASVIVAPLRLAFYSPNDGMPIHAFAYFLDLFFLVDAVLGTLLLAEDELISVEHREEEIARQRLHNEDGSAEVVRSIFVDTSDIKLRVPSWSERVRRDWVSHFLNFLAVVPWELLNPEGSCFSGVNVMGLIRVLRFRRFWAFLQWISIVVWFPHYVSVVANYITFVGLAAHFEGCTYYLLARGRGFSARTWVGAATCNDRGVCLDDLEVFDQFLSSVYWSMQTISTVGYGDLTPQAAPEYAFVILAMMINLALTCYTVAAVSVMFKREEEVASFRKDVSALSGYLSENKLPARDVAHMIDYKRITFGLKRGHEVMGDFPDAIRTRVAEQRFLKMLKRTHLFNRVAGHFRQRCLSHSSENLFLEGMIIANAGDVLVEAYILHSGVVNVIVDTQLNSQSPMRDCEEVDCNPMGGEFGTFSNLSASRELRYAREGKRVVATLTAGAVLCGEAFFASSTQPWTLVAASNVTVLAIPASELATLQNEPANFKLVLQNIRRDVESFSRRARGFEKGGTRNYSKMRSTLDSSAANAITTLVTMAPMSPLREASGSVSPGMELVKKQKLSSVKPVSSSIVPASATYGSMATADVVVEEEKKEETSPEKKKEEERKPGRLGAPAALRAALSIATMASRMKLERQSRVSTNVFANIRLDQSFAAACDAACALLVACEAQNESHLVSLLCDQASRGDCTSLRNLAEQLVRSSSSEGEKSISKELKRISDYDLRTPAHVAAAMGQIEVLKILAEFDFALDCADAEGGQPLLDAVLKAPRLPGDGKALLDAAPQPDVDVIDFLRLHSGCLKKKNLGELMCSFAASADITTVARLVRAGADVNAADYDGRVALHVSAAEGHLETVRVLCRAGNAQVDSQDRWGQTACMEAVVNGHGHVLGFLIGEKANLDAKNNAGFSVLYIAVKAGRDDCCELLMTGGARLLLEEPGSVLCNAASEGDSRLVLRLLRAGLDPNVRDYDKRTALHIAASDNKWPVVTALLEHGAAEDSLDRWGHDAASEAQRAGHTKIAEYIHLFAKQRDEK